jgi:hypothetical protein
MRPLSIVGLILVVLGVLVLSVHSFTFFTTEHQTGPLGFFTFEVSKPHTIFVNPIAGIVAVAVGLALTFTNRRKTI